jgi:hypothetical protein
VTIKVKLSDLLRVGISAQSFHDEMRHWHGHTEFVEAEKKFPFSGQTDRPSTARNRLMPR